MNLKDCYDKYLNSKSSITEECIENALIYHLINELNYTYREDIKDSFQLKQNFREKYEELNSHEFDDKEFEKILEERKSALAEVVKEYDVLVKSTPSKEEINKESEKEFSLFAEKRRKQAAKKRLKKEKKRKKTELKEKKKLIRLQPKGTTIMEIKTITTSDPDEDKRRK